MHTGICIGKFSITHCEIGISRYGVCILQCVFVFYGVEQRKY